VSIATGQQETKQTGLDLEFFRVALEASPAPASQSDVELMMMMMMTTTRCSAT